MLSTMTLHGNSVGLIVGLVGMVGGFYVTNYRDKLKAQKAKIQRKNDLPPRE
jgi:preprotein translocase subunit YajC